MLQMAVQPLLPDSPEGNHLSMIAQAVVPADLQPITASATNVFSKHFPACNVEVALHDITTAVCEEVRTRRLRNLRDQVQGKTHDKPVFAPSKVRVSSSIRVLSSVSSQDFATKSMLLWFVSCL